MASKVIEFRRPDRPVEPVPLLDAVTIREKSDIFNASGVLARAAADRCLRVMLWHDISSQEPIVDVDGKDLNAQVFGWKADGRGLWKDYDRASRSQIIRGCRVEGEPFWVNRHGFRTRLQNPFLQEITLDDFEERSYLKAAIVIPLHLPFGQISVAIFSSANPARKDLSREFAQFGPLFSDLSRRYLSSYVTTMRDNPYLPPANVLTRREVECLRWAAFGKTDDEISMILFRSHATVRYHIKRICDKLGAVNRAQAIFRAGQLGYLGSAA